MQIDLTDKETRMHIILTSDSLRIAHGWICFGHADELVSLFPHGSNKYEVEITN